MRRTISILATFTPRRCNAPRLRAFAAATCRTCCARCSLTTRTQRGAENSMAARVERAYAQKAFGAA